MSEQPSQSPHYRIRRVFGTDLLEMLDSYVDQRIEVALNLREHERRWLSVDEAAQYIGSTEKAIRARIARRTIPFVRDGGRVLIDRLALDRQLEAGR